MAYLTELGREEICGTRYWQEMGGGWRTAKNYRRRPRYEYSQQVQKDVDCNSDLEMRRFAQDRAEWRAVSNQAWD